MSLTACGNSSSGEAEKGESDSDTDEQIELTLGHIYVDASNGQTVAWEKALNEYRELHPNVTIKEDKADNDAYKTKLKTTLAAGSAPDVFCSWGGGFSTSFVEAGIVENLDPYVEAVSLIWIRCFRTFAIISIMMIPCMVFRWIAFWEYWYATRMCSMNMT